MIPGLMMFISIIATLVLPVVAVVGIVTYVRRTRRLQDGGRDGSFEAAVLDSLDQVHLRLDAMSTRLHRMEEASGLKYVAGKNSPEAEEARRVAPGKSSE